MFNPTSFRTLYKLLKNPLPPTLLQANEDFVATFERAYTTYEQRIGAPSSVNLVRRLPVALAFVLVFQSS